MKLATLPNGTPDGRLVIVSRDLTRAADAAHVAPTLQAALERWQELSPALASLYADLNAGRHANAVAFSPGGALAPLPRAWQWLDGSAFPSHGELMDKVFNITPERTGRPLMYQGLSCEFLPPTADVPFPSADDGIDFEGEFGVISDAVPMHVTAAEAATHIRLVVQINDWSLRKLAPIEMKTGFGWIQAKPACSMAPVAVTPDELGDAWRGNRVHLPLTVQWNNQRFGNANGGAMAFGFDELLAYAAYSRTLCAGTVLGSGTVSNPNYREIGSSCIAERRGIEVVDKGAAHTDYMRFGERVRMEVFDAGGQSVFGAIDQQVVALRR